MLVLVKTDSHSIQTEMGITLAEEEPYVYALLNDYIDTACWKCLAVTKLLVLVAKWFRE
ncbi:unnamed protein product, partial [Gongylonema pulchrum]